MELNKEIVWNHSTGQAASVKKETELMVQVEDLLSTGKDRK